MASNVLQITDPATGSAAQILVDVGFNCFSWQPTLSDGPREMLWAEPGFLHGDKLAGRSGIPLLFPFTGRILGAKYSFKGRDYRLEANGGNVNAIHGFVYTRPWRVVEQSASRVVAEFQASIDDPSLLNRWPSDFRIRASYEIRAATLLSKFRGQNTGDGPLPWSFGTHAYFRLPVSDGGDPEATIVHVPGTETWEEEGFVLTGRKIPATGVLDLQNSEPLAGRTFDHYITNLQADSDGRLQTRLTDSRTGRVVTESFDQSFLHCVVYTPPHRQAICLEPWTSLADAFAMEAAGVATGMRILEPGEAWETQIELDVKSTHTTGN